MELLSYIFGQSGLLNTFLGGHWYIIPLILLSIFLIYLYVNRVSSDNLLIFTLLGMLLFTVDDLFRISDSWLVGFVVLILFVIGGYAYIVINRTQ